MIAKLGIGDWGLGIESTSNKSAIRNPNSEIRLAIRVAISGLLALAGCKQKAAAPVYQLEPVSTRDITVAVNANGSIQPKDSVEIKSKASGEIIRITVQTGDEVKKGQQLVVVDQRNPKNTLDQAKADLEVAQAQLANAQSQMKRADELFKDAPEQYTPPQSPFRQAAGLSRGGA